MSHLVRVRSRTFPVSPWFVAASLCVAAPTAAAAPQVWGKQISTGSIESVADVVPDGAGGTYECGQTYGDLGGEHLGLGDAFVTRRDADGQVLWSRSVATTSVDEGVGIAADGQGGVYLVGNYEGQIDLHLNVAFEVFVAHYDAAGNALWQIDLSVTDYEYEVAFDCAADGAGGLLVCGASYRDHASAYWADGDMWLARIDALGDLRWLTPFGGKGTESCTDLIGDGGGGAFLCGSTSGGISAPLIGNFDGWYARFDALGALQWVRQIGAPSQTTWSGTAALAIELDGSGGFYLGGSTDGSLAAPLSGPNDVFLGRFDAQGDPIWLEQFGSDLADGLIALAEDGRGGVHAAGFTQGVLPITPSGLSDTWLRRFDAAGNVSGALQIGSLNIDMPTGLARLGDAVVAVGNSIGSDDFFGENIAVNSGWIARFEDCDFDSKANFCSASANSTGVPAAIGNSGTTHVSNNDFGLFASGLPTVQPGVFLMATGTGNVPFGNGTLCVGGSVQRLGSSSTANGVAKLALDFTDPSSLASQISAGSTWNFQFWFRDLAGGGAQFNLSNGLSVTFCP